MATTTAEAPEDDEAWLYGDPEKKEEMKAEAEAAASTLSADAAPFEPATAMETPEDNDDKEAGEVSGEDAADDDSDDDDDDVQVTIGDIKTQPQTYEKFKSGYTRSGQAKQHSAKGVDLETPGTINDQNIYDYDLTTLNIDERAWRKPGADITDYFNYGFTEDTWMKYCEKQKYLRNENGVSSKMFIHSLPSAPRRESAPPPPKPVDPPTHTQSPQSYRPPTTPTQQQSSSSITVTPTSAQSAAALAHLAGPPPGRKMSGTIDVIGGTRNDSRRPTNMYDYENQSPSNSHTTDYSKKWTPTDLPPPHIPPPNYGVPPPMSVPPPGPVPPPHMGAPPLGYYPAPTGPPPDRGPPPGYDNRGAYGYESYGAPPGYGAPPPVQPSWDNRGGGGGPPYGGWDYGGRERSPARSESDFSRDLNYERNRQGRPRSRERSERGESSTRDRERRHRDRERVDREKEERHRRSRKEGSVGAEHKSKHKKSKRSKRDKDDESMDTSNEPGSTPPP